MSNLEIALDYLRRGWSVVPAATPLDDGTCSCRDKYCERVGKHPRVKYSEYRERRATEQEIRTWWRRWPDANIAIVTGAISGLVAIDIDPRHGGDDAWREWATAHDVPETVIALTGGGGEHHLFVYPGVHVDTCSSWLPGVDCRADDNGYIIAPGSRHSSGRTYEWDSGAHPDDMAIAEMPAVLLDAINNRMAGNGGGHEKSTLDLEGIFAGTVKVPESIRNVTMARIVGHLIKLHEAGEGTILMMAMRANEVSFEPPMAEREVQRVVTSIMRREERSRIASERSVTMLRAPEAAIDQVEMTEVDRVTQAEALWREVGVPVVTDWYALLGGSAIEYILLTPENEVRLGSDLLDYLGIRRVLLNQISVLMPSGKKPGDWDSRMRLLRQLVREEVIEATRASEQIDDWLDEFLRQEPPVKDPEMDTRREYLDTGMIEVDGERWLRPTVLARFIDRRLGERIETRDVRKLLRRAGWESATLAAGSGTTVRAWRRVS